RRAAVFSDRDRIVVRARLAVDQNRDRRLAAVGRAVVRAVAERGGAARGLARREGECAARRKVDGAAYDGAGREHRGQAAARVIVAEHAGGGNDERHLEVDLIGAVVLRDGSVAYRAARKAP